MDERLSKRERFQEGGELPYGAEPGFPGRRPVAALLASEDPDAETPAGVVVAGRVIAHRDHGNSMFLDLRDGTGRIQAYLNKQAVGPERFGLFKEALDLGDFVSVEGTLGRSKKGEVTVFATGIRLLTKSLAAPPKEHFGLADTETRYRQRYVDLAVNVDSFERFAIRSAVVSTLRGVLVEHDFMEVETPLLHAIAGGATARPFITHHNSLGIDLYLRIAPELYLKRLLVGGYERVFEIGRSFRNEGLSPRHNPEFTMLEAYWAYARGDDWMDLMERTIERLAREHGAMGRRRGDEGMPAHEVHYEQLVLDMSAPFKRARYADLVAEHAGVDIFDAAAVEQAAAARGIETAGRGTARIADDLFGACVESHLTQPTFVTHFPIELSPLAKASPEDPRVAERFELYMAGLEVANGFSELNDPDEQLRRFEQQVAAKDPELPGQVDHDYVEALRYGLPPAAGIGVGIDRLVMLLTDTPTIRDVILFPLLRPLERD